MRSHNLIFDIFFDDRMILLVVGKVQIRKRGYHGNTKNQQSKYISRWYNDDGNFIML